MAIEQVVCKTCNGRGAYTLGPYPASKCNNCGGKGYVMIAVKKTMKGHCPTCGREIKETTNG